MLPCARLSPTRQAAGFFRTSNSISNISRSSCARSGARPFTRGAALTTADYSGTALWLAPDAAPDEAALGKLVEDGVAAEKQAEMATIVEQMSHYHPDEPHWYLPFIGVTPARQGQGYGAALLRAQLAVCDKAQLPAYLESTGPKSQPLYERHGFRAIAEIKVGSCPPIVPMLRRPLPPQRL